MRTTIWKKSADSETLNKKSSSAFGAKLGIKITEIGDDYLQAKLLVDERFHQPYGIMHGGLSCLVAEEVGSIAANLACSEDAHAVGLTIDTSHLSPVRTDEITATARPIRVGRTVQVWNIDITSSKGKLVSSTKLTMSVQRK